MLRFALRELHAYYTNKITLAILIGSSIIAILSGPFGTLENLNLWQRALYWCFTVFVCAGLARLAFIVMAGVQKKFPMHNVIYSLLANALGAFCIASFVFGFIQLLWGEREVLPSWLLLFFIAFVIGAFICIIIEFVTSENNAPEIVQTNNALFERLPKALGRDLVSISAQDHYLKVTTVRGSEMILMRLSDAIGALPKEMGLQIHRSHWVARSAILSLSKEGGKWEFLLKNNERLPISRNYRKNVKELDF